MTRGQLTDDQGGLTSRHEFFIAYRMNSKFFTHSIDMKKTPSAWTFSKALPGKRRSPNKDNITEVAIFGRD